MKKFLHSLLILFMGIGTAAFAQQGEAPEITPWDGKALKVDIRLGDTLTYEYTATDKGTLYVYADDQSDADYLKVDIWGGLYADGAYDEVIKLEDTGFFDEDYQTGVFGKIELWENEKLRFTLAAPADSWGERTKFTLKTKFFPAGTAGGNFESPVMLAQNSKVTLATFDNTLEFLDETHATFCSFTAPSDGVASIYTKAYLIYYIETENFGVEQLKEVIESNKAQYEHEFIVKKGQSYLVVVPNSRFIDVTFKMTQDRLGLSAEFPNEISEFPATLDLVKGDNYYKFDYSKVGSHTMMEVVAAAGWNGNISYLEGTNWGAIASDELAADAVSGGDATFYKNLDQRFLSYGNAIVINFNVKDQSSAKATLTLREPAEGESFEKAIAATLGENTFNGPARDHWFAYTAETDCEISFASSGTVKHVNFTAGVEQLVATNVYRVDEGVTIYVCVASKTAGDNTLTITSKEIVAGDYCDKPIEFKLGEDITVKGDTLNVRDKFHSFVAEENGFAVFTSPGWSIHFREECGGRRLDAERIVNETPIEGAGNPESENFDIQFTYKLPVLAGKTYIVELEAVSDTLTIATGFEEAAEGDVCATAIEIENLNDTIKFAYEFGKEKWYKVTAEKNGYYTIYAKLGQAANMKTKVGDCDAAETNAPSDNNKADAYMGGYKAAKVYVEEGETLYIYTKTGSENDEELFGNNFYLVATFAEPRPGENVDLAIEAKAETEYTVLNNDAEGYEQWYSYTIPAGKELTITLKATMKFIINSLSFYKDDKVTSMSAYKQDFTQTNLTNEAGETIGKNYVFAATDADRTIYIKVSTVNAIYNPVVWKIEGENEGGDDTGVAVEKADAEATVIYDLMGRRVENPTKGIYIINGVKRVIK